MRCTLFADNSENYAPSPLVVAVSVQRAQQKSPILHRSGCRQARDFCTLYPDTTGERSRDFSDNSENYGRTLSYCCTEGSHYSRTFRKNAEVQNRLRVGVWVKGEVKLYPDLPKGRSDRPGPLVVAFLLGRRAS